MMGGCVSFWSPWIWLFGPFGFDGGVFGPFEFDSEVFCPFVFDGGGGGALAPIDLTGVFGPFVFDGGSSAPLDLTGGLRPSWIWRGGLRPL